MAMSTGGGEEGGVNSEINITPLADVMLVLLIIFMITAPLSQHSIKVTLPQANPHSEQTKKLAPPIDVAVKPDGTLYWKGQQVSQAQFHANLLVAAQRSPQPPLEIRADKTTRYKVIRKLLETAKASGMVHMEFVTSAPPKH